MFTTGPEFRVRFWKWPQPTGTQFGGSFVFALRFRIALELTALDYTFEIGFFWNQYTTANEEKTENVRI